MCDTGEPITYESMIPPELQEYRKALYRWADPSQQVPQYPGPLPFTQPPDMGQMAGMNTILQMMGMGPWSGPQMPGVPGNIGWGNYFGWQGGGGAGGGGGGERISNTREHKEKKENREEYRKEKKERRNRDPNYDPYRAR